MTVVLHASADGLCKVLILLSSATSPCLISGLCNDMQFVTYTGNGDQCQQRGNWSGITLKECETKTCESEGFIMVHSEEICVSWRCQEGYWPPSNASTSTTGVFSSRSTILVIHKLHTCML